MKNENDQRALARLKEKKLALEKEMESVGNDACLDSYFSGFINGIEFAISLIGEE